jgi:hypothetical protein
MAMDVKEWWQEYDRRKHKKAARQIARWMRDPVGEKLPDDWDMWDPAEERAILAAWVNLVKTRFILPDETPQMLADAEEALIKSPTKAMTSTERSRLRLFLPKLRAAWEGRQTPVQTASTVPVRGSELQEKLRQGF